LLRPGHREFFLDLAGNPKTRHLVHVSRIEIGDICAATNFGIVFGDCYYHVLASYVDSEVAHYGPGALHLRELLAYAIKRGLKCFDFTIGDEQYKFGATPSSSCTTIRRRRSGAACRRAPCRACNGAASG
jgi:CelD/BcsL family acetyltransferase involved in cellulose biosynthesis